MVAAYTPFVQFLLIRLITEKDKKLKQGMEIMGLADYYYWGGWIVTYFILIFVMTLLFLLLGSIEIWKERHETEISWKK